MTEGEGGIARRSAEDIQKKCMANRKLTQQKMLTSDLVLSPPPPIVSQASRIFPRAHARDGGGQGKGTSGPASGHLRQVFIPVPDFVTHQ